MSAGMDSSRRSILKLFGISAAAGVVAAPAVVEAATEVSKPWINPFELPHVAPKGMKYQWKRVFIDSEMPDMGNIAEMIGRGWKPVPLARHRKLFPDIDHKAYWIEVGGMVLMEKPI